MGATVSVVDNHTYYINNHINNDIIEEFIHDRILSVSQKMIKSKSAPYKPDKNIYQNGTVKETVSLKNLATRHHSRQRNTYVDSTSICYMGKSGYSLKLQTPYEPNNTSLHAISEKPQKKTKPTLRLQINDDEDWIQVSDDELDATLSPHNFKGVSLGSPDMVLEQSYMATQSGTLFVKGFCEGIGMYGLSSDVPSVQLTMRERFVVLCTLGKGAGGVVYKALDIVDNRLVALKMVPLFERDKRHQFVRELCTLFGLLRAKEQEYQSTTDSSRINLLSAVKSTASGVVKPDSLCEKISPSGSEPLYPHHYIVDFYDAYSDMEEGGVGLVMEYMDGGSLQDVVESGGCRSETVLANIALQVLVGLEFLHSCNQIHRDIKPANLLINQNGEAKISDLGILRQLCPEEITDKMHRANTFVGTTVYMSPERMEGIEYSYSSDIWSFGLSLLAIATGELPIDLGRDFFQLLHTIRDGPGINLPPTEDWSGEFRHFISQCLQPDPDQRATATELLKHPFILLACPEEPEYNQKVLKSELQSIIHSLCSHLEALRLESIEVLSRCGSSQDQKHEDVETKSVSEIAREVLLGVDTKDTSGSVRLNQLAHQLHLTPNVAYEIVNDSLTTYRSTKHVES